MMAADFSLETFRHKLDEQGMSIAENQEQSVKSRKKLAETTRGKTVFLRPHDILAGAPGTRAGLTSRRL